MCNDAGLYDGGNADGDDRNAHGFLIDCSPLVAHAYAGCYAGVADLDGGADTACTAGGQCVDGKNKTGFYPFCDAGTISADSIPVMPNTPGAMVTTGRTPFRISSGTLPWR